MENRAWKVDVFTDGNGRKIYTVEIEAAYEGEAIALAKAEVALPLAILNPLTKDRRRPGYAETPPRRRVKYRSRQTNLLGSTRIRVGKS